MKKNILIFSLLTLLLFVLVGPKGSFKAFAQSTTSSPTSEPSEEPDEDSALDKIRILKDKVATKVAQLRSNEKSAVRGTVSDITDSEITLTTPNKGTIKITYTEDTPFYVLGDSKKEGDLSDIEEGANIVAFGYYDGENKMLEGRVIYNIDSLPSFLSGKIADIDRENFTVTVRSNTNKDYIIDIETYTRTQGRSQDNTFARSGFSRLLPGDAIQVVAIPNEKEENRFHGRRILVIESTQVQTPTSNPKDE